MGETMVNEFDNIFLKELNVKIMPTIGKTFITLVINNKIIKTDFQVVDSDFSISKDGILEIKFMAKNQTVIDTKIIARNQTINKISERAKYIRKQKQSSRYRYDSRSIRKK